MQFIRGSSGSKSNVPQFTPWLVSNKSSTVWFMLSIKYKPMGVYIRKGFVSNFWAYLQRGILLKFHRIRLNLFFLCFKLFKIHCHTQSRERNISTKNKLNKNINYNFAIRLASYLAISCTIKLTSNKRLSVHNYSYPLGKTIGQYWIPHRIQLLREKKNCTYVISRPLEYLMKIVRTLVWTVEMLVFSCFKSD